MTTTAPERALDGWLTVLCLLAVLVTCAVMVARQSLILAALAEHDARAAQAVETITAWQRTHDAHGDAEITRQVKPEALK